MSSQYEFEHFKLHPFKNVKIRILDIIDDCNDRVERENFFILKYKTVYPYGLNDRVNNVSVTGIKDNTCIYKEVLNNITFDSNRRVRIRSRNKVNRFIDFNEVLQDINEAIFSSNNIVGYVKRKILGLKRSKAKVFAKHVKIFELNITLLRI